MSGARCDSRGAASARLHGNARSILLAVLMLPGLLGGCRSLPAPAMASEQSVSASAAVPNSAASTATAPAARFAAQPALAPASACAAGESAWTRETLYFGRAMPGGGTVSDAHWRDFVETTLAVLFPDGFTVLSAEGQWRGADGAVVREPSQVVILLHSGDALSDAAVGVAVEEYKRRFRQEAVLRERGRVCVRF